MDKAFRIYVPDIALRRVVGDVRLIGDGVCGVSPAKQQHITFAIGKRIVSDGVFQILRTPVTFWGMQAFFFG